MTEEEFERQEIIEVGQSIEVDAPELFRLGGTTEASDQPATSLSEAALEYASNDIRVFPLYNPTPDGCSCGKHDCKSVGKHPRTKKGFNEATTSSQMVEYWWDKWPEANIGIPTGEVTGRVVLDVDFRHHGDKSLAELEEQYGRLPETRTIRTGNGIHLEFQYPTGHEVGSRSGLRGLAVRGRSAIS